MREPPRIDRRALRTRAALRASVTQLIGEHGLAAVRVQDICARAGVGRSTFYAHFRDVEGLLVAGLDELQGELRSAITDAPFGFVAPLVAHVHDHLRVSTRGAASFRRFVNGGGAVHRRFVAMVEALVADELDGLGPHAAARTSAVRFLGGSFVRMLDWSMMPTCNLAPHEVGAEFVRLARPVLDELRGHHVIAAARGTTAAGRARPLQPARSAARR